MGCGEDRADCSIKSPNFATEVTIKPIWLGSTRSLIDLYRSRKRIVRRFLLILTNVGSYNSGNLLTKTDTNLPNSIQGKGSQKRFAKPLVEGKTYIATSPNLAD